MPTVAELIAALPEPADETDFGERIPPAQFTELMQDWSLRSVPVGWFHRMRVLGTLQAKISAAYPISLAPPLVQERRREPTTFGRDALADGAPPA